MTLASGSGMSVKAAPVFLFLFLLTYIKASKACTENQYRKTLLNGNVECVDCPKCIEGYGLVVECGLNLTAFDRVDCKLCTKGTDFSASHDYEQCKPCSVCSKDQAMTPCTTHSNTVCHKRCISKQNYYEKSSDDCQECSWCCGDADDIIESECLRKGMPKQKSCTVHRKKKCTPAPSTRASSPSATVKPLTQFPLTNATSQPSTIKSINTSLIPPNFTTHDFKTAGKHGDDREDKPNNETIVLGCLAGILLVIVILGGVYYYCKKRKSPSNSTTVDESGIQLVNVQVDELHERAGTRRLFQTFEQHPDLEETVCDKLDLQESFIKVAQYYKMGNDKVEKLRERPGDHPTREVLVFVRSSFPSLLVTEFIACTSKIGRRDVTEVLIEASYLI